MVYIIIVLALISIVAILTYEASVRSRKAKKFFTISGGIATMLLMLTAGPLRVLNIFNMLMPLIQMIKNLRVHRKNFNAKNEVEEITEADARKILGISETATDREIKQAFKKLMLKNHPDHGGSEYIAKQLINAKNILLQKESKNAKIQ